jgi:xanthine/CO dehydrogenase XdhC/CoxF family maturation factor
MATQDRSAPAGREQSWSDEGPEHGRLVVVTDNPIARAMVTIAEAAERRTTLLRDEDVDVTPLEWLAAHPLTEQDAFVLCDHDTPDMETLLRAALGSGAGYVAMTGSRRRAESVFASLQDLSGDVLDRLHVPAGLDTGGKSPGEIALSIVAEVVAVSNGRRGGSLRR